MSLLRIKDLEASLQRRDARILELDEQLRDYQCVGVIDANGDIYPDVLEPGTQVFVKTAVVDGG